MGENVDRRYLGALKCIDRAAGFHLTGLMRVTSDDLEFIRNRSSLYVISKAAGLENHLDVFDAAPDTPAVGSLSFDVNVVDPNRRYLPRAIEIALPRDADPAHADNADSLFKPIEVNLYPSPSAGLSANWTAVRVSVTREASGSNPTPVAGALLRVIRDTDDEVLSSGLTDERGEGLVIVPGIPITQFADDDDSGSGGGGAPGEGPPGGGPPGGGPPGGGPPGGGPPGGGGGSTPPAPVVVSEISGRLEVSVAAGAEWPVDPDALEANHAANLVATETLTLRTGQTEKVAVQLT